MAVGRLEHILFTFLQLVILTVAKDVSSVKLSYVSQKPTEIVVPAYPANVDFSSWENSEVPSSLEDGFGSDPLLGGEHKRWKEVAVWGKRSGDPELAKKWKEMAVWGKRDSKLDLDKKWKDMSVWGKRDSKLDLDKKWKDMSVWGKRNSQLDLDKKWKDMSVWGKRSMSNPEFAKKWKEMAVWGKRNSNLDLDKKWKEMAVWGKRNANLDLDKKWKEMAVWGKRNSNNLDLDKKWKEMAVWGKRNTNLDLDKKWKEMAVWGKRDVPDGYMDKEMNKKWKDMSVWGKRSGYMVDELHNRQSPQLLHNTASSSGSGLRLRKKSNIRELRRRLDKWLGKRPSWSNTGFSSWGKRSADQDMTTLMETGTRGKAIGLRRT